jgi:hypothetical protein
MNVLRKTTLKIRSDRGELLAELVWQSGRTSATLVKPSLMQAVQRWISDGVKQWVGEGDDARPLWTRSTDPEFLVRLEEHLAHQFPFRLSVRQEEREIPVHSHRVLGPGLYSMMLPFNRCAVQWLGGSGSTAPAANVFGRRVDEHVSARSKLVVS